MKMTTEIIQAMTRIPQQLWPGIQRQRLAPHKMKLSVQGGLAHEAFDGSGRVRPWYLLSFVEKVYTSAFYRQPNDNLGSFLDFDDVFSDSYLFNFISQLNISKNLYDVSYLKCPLEVIISLDHVGKTSMTRRTEVTTPSSPEPLFTNRLMAVHADQDTRKSSPIPEPWINKYRHLAQGEPIRFRQAKRPDDPRKIMSFPVKVLAGDIDAYAHVNFAMYLKYCLEGRIGAMLDRGQKITRRDLAMPVKSVTQVFLREGELGDTLMVEHWRGENGSWHFDVMQGDRPVSQAVVDFHNLEKASEVQSKL